MRKAFLFYLGVNVFNAGIPFFLLPVLTEYLSPTEFGLLGIVQVYIAVILPFIVLALPSLLTVDYHKLAKDELTEHISSSLIATTLAFVIISLLVLSLANFLSDLLSIPENWIMLMPLFAFFRMIPLYIGSLLRVKELPSSFAAYQCSLSVLNILITLYLLLVAEMSWEARLVGILVSDALFSIVGVFILYRYKYLTIKVKKSSLNSVFMYGIPLIPHTIAAVTINLSDRVFLEKLAGLEYVGIYIVGYQIGQIVNIIETSFNYYWVPHISKIFAKGDDSEHISVVKMAYGAMISYIFLSIIVGLSAPLIFDVFIDERYIAGAEVVFWVALGFAFSGMYKIVIAPVFYLKKTKVVASLSVVSAILNVALNYLMIPAFGILGAAYATMISMLVIFLVSWRVSNKLYPLPWLSCHTLK